MPTGGRRRTVLSDWTQAIGLSALGGFTLVLCFLAFNHANLPTTDVEAQPTAEASSPSVGQSASAQAAPPPTVTDQVRADFAAGDGLPDGSRIYNSSASSSGMALVDRLLVHGAPVTTPAGSYLETRVHGNVNKLGAVVRFASGSSGSIALVAWPSSMVAAGSAGEPRPASGMRLTATSHSWKATVGADREVIGEGEFAANGSKLSFEVVRDGADLWVTDPAGKITQVSNPRVAELAGPWACWELLETAGQTTPAAFEQVWAG